MTKKRRHDLIVTNYAMAKCFVKCNTFNERKPCLVSIIMTPSSIRRVDEIIICNQLDKLDQSRNPFLSLGRKDKGRKKWMDFLY